LASADGRVGHALAALWRGLPRRLRRWSVRLVEPTFTVTAGAVVEDDEGRILLLQHTFRPGSGWGIPGGFLTSGEQPEAAIARELEEEVGVEVERADLAFVRTIRGVNQVEVIFRCRVRGTPRPQSVEIRDLGWFAPDDLPPQLGADQRQVIRRVLGRE
jgi:8-oxo-dGTP diphosphatase